MYIYIIYILFEHILNIKYIRVRKKSVLALSVSTRKGRCIKLVTRATINELKDNLIIEMGRLHDSKRWI